MPSKSHIQHRQAQLLRARANRLALLESAKKDADRLIARATKEQIGIAEDNVWCCLSYEFPIDSVAIRLFDDESRAEGLFAFCASLEPQLD